ncbi:MAG: DUF1579 family protein [Chloroflexota bacterium]
MACRGGPGEGQAENRLALNGFAVIDDSQQCRGGQVNAQGDGVFRFDALESEYQLHWFDSMGQAPSVFRGTFEDDLLRLENHTEQGHIGASWDFSEPHRYHYRMEVYGEGDHWQLFTEGSYRRG